MQLILAPASSASRVNQGPFNVTAAPCRFSSCRKNSHRMDKSRADWEKGALSRRATVNLQLVNLRQPRSLYEVTFFQTSALLYLCMHGRLLRWKKWEEGVFSPCTLRKNLKCWEKMSKCSRKKSNHNVKKKVDVSFGPSPILFHKSREERDREMRAAAGRMNAEWMWWSRLLSLLCHCLFCLPPSITTITVNTLYTVYIRVHMPQRAGTFAMSVMPAPQTTCAPELHTFRIKEVD